MDKKRPKERFKNRVNKQINEFTENEARGWIIDCFLDLEYSINKVILDFFKPENKSVFDSVVLNSSILDTEKKVKILINIGVTKDIVEKLRSISRTRNAFAHGVLSETIHLNLTENHKFKGIDVEATIKTMNSEGKIQSKTAHSLLYEFNEKYREVRGYLNEFKVEKGL